MVSEEELISSGLIIFRGEYSDTRVRTNTRLTFKLKKSRLEILVQLSRYRGAKKISSLSITQECNAKKGLLEVIAPPLLNLPYQITVCSGVATLWESSSQNYLFDNSAPTSIEGLSPIVKYVTTMVGL